MEFCKDAAPLVWRRELNHEESYRYNGARFSVEDTRTNVAAENALVKDTAVEIFEKLKEAQSSGQASIQLNFQQMCTRLGFERGTRTFENGQDDISYKYANDWAWLIAASYQSNKPESYGVCDIQFSEITYKLDRRVVEIDVVEEPKASGKCGLINTLSGCCSRVASGVRWVFRCGVTPVPKITKKMKVIHTFVTFNILPTSRWFPAKPVIEVPKAPTWPMEVLTTLDSSRIFTDCIFKIEGFEKPLCGSRYLLAQASPCFRKMFSSGFTESEAAEVLIPMGQAGAVVNFVGYVHGNITTTNLKKQSVSHLLELAAYAHQMEATHIEQMAKSLIAEKMGAQDVQQIVAFCNVHHWEDLLSGCHFMADQHNLKINWMDQLAREVRYVPEPSSTLRQRRDPSDSKENKRDVKGLDED